MSDSSSNTGEGSVRQMRLSVTTGDLDQAVSFYRDTLGLKVEGEYSEGDGRVVILNGGRATLELADPVYAEYIDSVEVGSRVAGHIRVAFEVGDTKRLTDSAVSAGAKLLAHPTRTPWGSLNSRLDGPADLQLTLFQEYT